MICNENIHRIAKYFLFIVCFHLCFAQDEIELRLENDEDLFWKPPRRHLLYDSYSSSSMNGTEMVIYIIAVIIITLISICCKFCMKQECEARDDYSDAVVHPPPRRQNRTLPVAPSSGGRVLNPPRSSRSIILPPEAGVFTVDFTGIENPNYNPSIRTPPPSYHLPTVPQFSTHGPSDENPTPLLDLPPSYESVIREQKYPK